MDEKLAGLREEVVKLQAEREKLAELDAEREKGTAKGRTFEEAVAEALDTLAVARGDDCEAVGDVRGEGGKKGDVVVDDRRLRRGAARPDRLRGQGPQAVAQRARSPSSTGRCATAPPTTRCSSCRPTTSCRRKTNPLREFNGDKLFVVFDPDEGRAGAGGRLLARARPRAHVARRGRGPGPDAIRAEIERAEGAMQDVRRIKSQLTNATHRDRQRPGDPGRDGRHRARAPGADRDAARGRCSRGRPRRRVTDAPVARRIVVHGRVQGVFFRATVRDAARRAGASGWARNCADGSVEVHAEGSVEAVDAVEAACATRAARRFGRGGGRQIRVARRAVRVRDALNGSGEGGGFARLWRELLQVCRAMPDKLAKERAPADSGPTLNASFGLAAGSPDEAVRAP